MKRAIITTCCLLGAIGLYILGAVYAATIFFVVGVGLELVFWMRVLGGFPEEKLDI